MTMPDTDPLAVGVMVAYCGWNPLEQLTNASVVLDGNGTSVLFLPSLHVTGVSSVVVDPAWFDGTAGSNPYSASIGPNADVGWQDNGALVWQRPGGWPPLSVGGWPLGSGNITVTYSSGYADPPPDLIAALDSLAKRTSGGLTGVYQRRMGTAQLTMTQTVAGGGLLTAEQYVFDRYRIVRTA